MKLLNKNQVVKLALGCLLLLLESTATAQAPEAKVRAPAPPIEDSINTGDTDYVPYSHHMTMSARTLKPGKISFKPAPGNDPIRNVFLNNTLSIGISDRLELGTIPSLYFASSSFNIATKLNIFRSPEVSHALGLLYWDERAVRQAVSEPSMFNWSWMMNYAPSNSSFRYGTNLSFFDFRQNSPWRRNLSYSGAKVLVDVGYHVGHMAYLVPGISFVRANNYTDGITESYGGYGLSFQMNWPGRAISNLGVGIHHVPPKDETSLLLSLSVF